MMCTQHPRYKGIRRPSVPCPTCWQKWLDEELKRTTQVGAATNMSQAAGRAVYQVTHRLCNKWSEAIGNGKA